MLATQCIQQLQENPPNSVTHEMTPIVNSLLAAHQKKTYAALLATQNCTSCLAESKIVCVAIANIKVAFTDLPMKRWSHRLVWLSRLPMPPVSPNNYTGHVEIDLNIYYT